MTLSSRTTSGPNPFRSLGKVHIVLLALVALLGATAATTAVTARPTDGQLVVAEFANIGAMTSQAQVKIGGVVVGTTGTPTVDPDRKVALVPMNLEQKALPLHVDATATIRQLSLIGEKFVDLNPGTPSAPILQPGQGLPEKQTSFAEDYQNIVQALNDPTAAGLSSVLRTLGGGVANRGQNVQDIIRELKPAFGDTSALASSLSRQNQLLGQVIDQVQPVTNGLAADQGKTLDSTVGSATNLLATTAANEQQLRDTLQELPSTLAAAQKTLDDLTHTAGATQQTLADLRPTSDNLAAIAGEISTFTDSAQPALEAANPLLDKANALLDQARPLAAELRTTGGPLYDTVHGARPVVDSLTRNLGGPYGSGPDPICGGSVANACNDPRIQGVLGFLHNWALTTNGGDALSHYFRVFFVADTQNATGGVATSLIPGANNTLLKGQPAPGGSATGLTPTQEQSALGTLMGGR
ncbi:MlaD family protein [Actinomycetospora sp. TBRC 11914]|uniref:MlaD family protein n=1 Tax=Actinomycetospora sp. TBRC 11914 TaxID=2729387 RepID=UPI00145EE742|nr:MlaD family protein [Actinomycetospora sp. TBRC 11914]NMO92269.1 MCE family protein [Actinomycetospora sp. TBRC 11914]